MEGKPEFFQKELKRTIAARFNLTDLGHVVYDLDVRWDELPGNSVSAKAQSLVEYFSFRSELPRLVAMLEQHRPREEWHALLSVEAATPGGPGVDPFLLEQAKLLYDSLSGLRDELGAVLGELALFDASWKPKKRDRVVEALIALVHRNSRVNAIRGALFNLRHYASAAHADDKPVIYGLLQLGGGTLIALSDPGAVTPFPNHDVLEQFVRRVRKAKKSKDEATIKEDSRRLLSAISGDVSSRVQELVVQLERQMEARRH